MSNSNMYDNEYENVVSINTEDLLTQSNTVNTKHSNTHMQENQHTQDKKQTQTYQKNQKQHKIKEEGRKNMSETKYGNGIVINSNDESYQDNPEKYGDDSKYEPWSDNNIFFPIANKLVKPFHDLGLTPNMVTYLGTFCTLLAIYYISINEFQFATLSYFIGYLLDCVDGKLARKYKMTSKEGMVLDLVSDNISNLILMIFIVYKFGYFNWFAPVIMIMTMLLSLSYGLNEAIASYKATGSDNFIERRKKQIGSTSNVLDNIFLLITGMSYSSYRLLFPTYDEKKLNKWLVILKEFGPGNYTLLVTFIIFNLANEKAFN